MKIKNIILSAFLAAYAAAASAAPALPGVHRLTQPDGTVVETEIIGDEFFHYYVTTGGEFLMTDAEGVMRPMTVGADGSLRAAGEITGRATSQAERSRIMEAVAARRELVSQQLQSRVAPAAINRTFPTTGVVTGLIVMAEFQDVKFTEAATKEHYDELCNTKGLESDITSGSVIDYFTAQSNGRFTPEFDVFGPVTLPHDRAYYGTTNDVNNLMRDAALAADAGGLDFSKYDLDGDGFIDFFFVVFAGHGQAQGGPFESVWPAMQDLSNYVFDYFDGLNLGVAACSCELKGGAGTDLDGIGTICHEFSHILGLADIYDTGNTGGHGMSHYDIMDIGSYNDNQLTPSGYTAMDKWTLGWLEPTVLEESQKDVRLEPFDSTHQAIFIVNPDEPNEYYTLANRRQQGWDKGIPGHGLVISYCHYVPSFWRRNVVNSVKAAKYEHVRIVAADNVWATTLRDEAGDPFPGTSGNTSFSANSLPAAVWNATDTPFLPAVKNIRELEDGTILFDFEKDSTGVDSLVSDNNGVRVNGHDIIAPEGSTVFDVAGRRVGFGSLPSGVYVVVTPNGSVKVAL